MRKASSVRHPAILLQQQEASHFLKSSQRSTKSSTRSSQRVHKAFAKRSQRVRKSFVHSTKTFRYSHYRPYVRAAQFTVRDYICDHIIYACKYNIYTILTIYIIYKYNSIYIIRRYLQSGQLELFMSSLALLSKKYHEECVQKKECIDGLQLKQTYKNKSKRLWYRGIGCEATQIQGMQGMHLKA